MTGTDDKGFRLVRTDGVEHFPLPLGVTLSVGRAPNSDVAVLHATVARRHAELLADADGIHVRDLRSDGGTYLNGTRIQDSARFVIGDTIAFGDVAFTVEEAKEANAVSDDLPLSVDAIITIDRLQRGLVSRNEFARETDKDTLLQQIVMRVHQILPADRVALQLRDGTGSLTTGISRNRDGADVRSYVPVSLANKAVAERTAFVFYGSDEDQRFSGYSIMMQALRCAILCPMVTNTNKVIGLLYAENVTSEHRYTIDHLDNVVRLAEMAADAVESILRGNSTAAN